MAEEMDNEEQNEGERAGSTKDEQIDDSDQSQLWQKKAKGSASIFDAYT